MDELDLDKRNPVSNVRSDDKVLGRCMKNCFQCTGDKPTVRDLLQAYCPLCGNGLVGHSYVGCETSVPKVVCGETL